MQAKECVEFVKSCQKFCSFSYRHLAAVLSKKIWLWWVNTSEVRTLQCMSDLFLDNRNHCFWWCRKDLIHCLLITAMKVMKQTQYSNQSVNQHLFIEALRATKGLYSEIQRSAVAQKVHKSTKKRVTALLCMKTSPRWICLDLKSSGQRQQNHGHPPE